MVPGGNDKLWGFLVVALSLCLRPVLAEESSDNFDDYTCALPIIENQPVADSPIWSVATSWFQQKADDVRHQVQHPHSSIRKRVRDKVDDVWGSADANEKRVSKHRDVLLKMVPKSVTDACEKYLSELSSSLNPLFDDVGNETLGDEAGEESERRLEGGNLDDGKGGVDSGTSKGQCHAKPGHYCFSSVAKHPDLSPLQDCALRHTISPCPPGFFCDGGNASPVTCAGGVVCMSGQSAPKSCPAGHFCPVSIIKRKCKPGFDCPEGSKQPNLCDGGSYCPDGQSIPCPIGFTCPYGAADPFKCPYFARCPEKSSAQDWQMFCRVLLAIVLLTWVCMVLCVPVWLREDNGFRAWLPPRVPAVVLGLSWVANLDLLQRAASLFAPPEDVKFLGFSAMFGSPPFREHLLVLSAQYGLLVYAVHVSPKIAKVHVQKVLDLIVFVLPQLVLTLIAWDKVVLVILGNMFFALCIVWMLLSKMHTITLRFGFVGIAICIMTLQCWWANTLYIPKMLAFIIIAASVHDFILFCQVSFFKEFNKRRKGITDNALVDSPVAPLIGDLSPDAINCAKSMAEVEVAACVAAAARASLNTHVVQDNTAFHGQAWMPWIVYETQYRRSSGSLSPVREDSGISVELSKVSYEVPSGKTLLNDLSFVIPAGSSVAVMGASGAGKTTLLSVLSGRCGDDSLKGNFRVNRVLTRASEMAELRPLFGFVPQDDVMHRSLTITENIKIQAQLRAARNTKSEASDIDNRVSKVVEGLGLAHYSDRLVRNGLSGGQRKRVSIGMEVASQPRMLFLDEPTTGLDSATAHRIIEVVLSQCTEDRCTSFSTIHLPRWRTLQQFDALVLLAPGGYLCFAGPVAVVQAYFSDVLGVDFAEEDNPADKIIDVCTFESARQMAVDGVWKAPPQCLRPVLFPTPQACTEFLPEETEEGWLQIEFGRMMSLLWQEFSRTRGRIMQAEPQGDVAGGLTVEVPDRGSPILDDGTNDLLLEAKAKSKLLHWGKQLKIHTGRALLILSRELWPTVVLHLAVLYLAMQGILAAYPGHSLEHSFLKTNFMLMLLCCAQSVASQRIFAGEECNMALREARLSSLSQVLFSFFGKDIASMVEIFLATFVWTLTYWPYAHSSVPCAACFELGFAVLYCHWGLNHILAITMPTSVALLVGIIATFMAFLFSGMRPPAHLLLETAGTYGSLFLQISPIRWALAFWFTEDATADGSPLFRQGVKDMVEKTFAERSFTLKNFQCPTPSDSVIERWASGASWVCSTSQLYVLGFLYRSIALCVLLITSVASASGGKVSFGGTSYAQNQVMRNMMHTFILCVFLLNIHLLGFTR